MHRHRKGFVRLKIHQLREYYNELGKKTEEPLIPNEKSGETDQWLGSERAHFLQYAFNTLAVVLGVPCSLGGIDPKRGLLRPGGNVARRILHCGLHTRVQLTT
ncbi:hypothetical protein BDW59DRAFT_146734 [Aspergillus cavernicola]|uniref:Uncharacterized protein n=1 Tax=Aspergillus cavernicola TaxID=176166 RepID=A0ABR4IBM9_9EURO